MMEKDESLRKFSNRLLREGFKSMPSIFRLLVFMYLFLALVLLALALVVLAIGHNDNAIRLVEGAAALLGIALGVMLVAYLAALTKRIQELAG